MTQAVVRATWAQCPSGSVIHAIGHCSTYILTASLPKAAGENTPDLSSGERGDTSVPAFASDVGCIATD